MNTFTKLAIEEVAEVVFSHNNDVRKKEKLVQALRELVAHIMAESDTRYGD